MVSAIVPTLSLLLTANFWETVGHEVFCMEKCFTFRRHLLVSMFFLLCSFSAFAADNLIYSLVEINVEKAGTLSTLIGNERKFRITNLKLSGKLNGTDIKWLREMAGSEYYTTGSTSGFRSTTDGKLEHLDMADATLLSGYDSYAGPYRIENDNEIGWAMFTYCQSLLTIKLPKSVTKIEGYAFSDCSNLKSITIYDGVTFIDHDSFFNCRSLESVVIPNSVETLGECSFANCANLESVVLPNKLNVLNAGMFYACI